MTYISHPAPSDRDLGSERSTLTSRASAKPYTVRLIYSSKQREELKNELNAIIAELNVGMDLLCSAIQRSVKANNARIKKPDGSSGLHVDQISAANLRGFLRGSRMADERVQLVDSFVHLYREEA